MDFSHRKAGLAAAGRYLGGAFNLHGLHDKITIGKTGAHAPPSKAAIMKPA